MEQLFKLIKTLIYGHFYGKLIITFEHGRIVHVDEGKSHDVRGWI